ncbi:MAG: uroporphyrinogen decarboxylase family protein [Victivallaceae bacterium]|nr:uroporphyrinogen decarboxylase family protein [Victivallaceae bacterium]
MTGKDKIYSVLRGEQLENIPCVPMIIRFCAADNGIKLRDYFLNAELFSECQLKTADKFGLDGIMMASEPTRIAKVFGGEVDYLEDCIPHVIKPPVAEERDLDKLFIPDFSDYAGRMGNLVEAVEYAVRNNCRELSIFGWADAPFTEACNMMGVENMLMTLYDNPSFAHQLLEFNTKLIAEFLEAQLEKGCDCIGIGDAAASLLNPEMYAEFAYPYEVQLITHFQSKKIPLKLHMCGNNTDKLDKIITTGIDILNVDQETDIFKARKLAPQLCLKGNVDPVWIMKNSSPEIVYGKCAELINIAGPERYIVSGGCELPPDMPEENLRAMVLCAKERGANA